MTQFHGATRALGLGLVVVVAIAVILFVWRSDATNPKAAIAPEVATDSATEQAPQVPSKPAEASNDPARELAPQPTSVAESAGAAAATRTVQGTLRFRNESANPVPASGKVVLTLGESGASREVWALHKDGVFSFPAEEDETECAVVSISIGRLEARATSTRHTISAAGTLAIEIEWSPGTLLHVVDAATGTELDDVTLVAAVNAGLLGLSQPVLVPPASVRQTPLLRGQNSPFPLPRAASVVTCWLRAPGHAWTSVHFEGGEGERRVALQRESALELRVTWDSSSTRSVFLTLEDPLTGAWLLRDRLEAQSPLSRFESLPPGTWAAQLAHSIRGNDVVLARSVLELRPGETTEWNVPSLSEGVRQTGSVSLLVRTPEGASPCSSAELLGPLPVTPRSDPMALGLDRLPTPGEWKATFLGLAPGEYELSVPGWSLTRTVSVFESQVTAVEFDVPTLVPVVVHVVDEHGAALDLAVVEFRPAIEGAVRHGDATAIRTTRSGYWRAMVQPGSLEMVASAPGMATARKQVVVGSEGAEVEFTLSKSKDLALRLRVRKGEALLPVAVSSWTKVRFDSMNGLGQVTQLAFGNVPSASSVVTATFSAPGRYRVTLPRGFADLASERSFEVDVLDGSGAELELQLDG